MNSFERVMSVVQGKKPDRMPVGLTLSMYGAKLTGCPLNEYYRNPAEYVRGQIAVAEEIGPDMILSPFSLPLEAEAFGSEVVLFPDSPPNLRRPVIRSLSEVADLKGPDIESSRSLNYFREAIRGLSPELKKRNVPLVGACTAPTDLPALILGIDLWLEILLFHENIARHILDITCEHFIKWVEAISSDGINILCTPLAFCNSRIVTEKIIKRTMLPFLKEIMPEIKIPVILHHGGAPIGEFINTFESIPNIAGYYVDPSDSLSECRSKISESKLLIGNIRGPNLWSLNSERIKKKCIDILKDREEDRYFILGTSCADIAYKTPIENIRTIVKAADEYR